MRDEALSDESGSITSLRFAARKVRMASEYFVEVVAPDRQKYRIGPFKCRSLARNWISLHAGHWLPAKSSFDKTQERNRLAGQLSGTLHGTEHQLEK